MSVRSRSRSPVRSNDDNMDDDEPLFLFIGNLPKEMHFTDLKELLVDKYFTDMDIIEGMGFIHIIKENGKPKGEYLIRFDSVENCEKALQSMQDAEYDGKKLVVKIDTGKLVPYSKKVRVRKYQEAFKQKPNQAAPRSNKDLKQRSKSMRLYGLSEEFLQSLGIQLPLSCRVFVGHLAPEVTETKLREVFSLAGNVVWARKFDSFGKVGFDHPVEAVQAISMFDGQKLYNSKMLVRLDKGKNRPVLPEGLEGIGKGLGFGGKPMRAVRMLYELQPLKEVLLNEFSKLQNQPDTNQKAMPMLSVNTSQAQYNSLLSLIQQLQEKPVGDAVNFAAMQGNPFNQNMFNNVQSQHTPPTSRFDIPPNALAFAQHPLSNINAMGNAQNPLANFNAVGNAQNPLANFNAVGNAMNPLANINAIGNAMNPLANINAMGNTQNPQANINAMGNTQNPQADMNAMGNAQNPMSNLQAALANIQNFAQNQQTPRSRFDIPPSAMPNASTSGANHNWGSGQKDFSNYQTTPQNQSNQAGHSNHQINPNEFDVQRHSDLNKSEDTVKSSDMLLFQDLPPSVTSKALINKMREVGELVLAEMTGEGRAVVRFRHVRDAEQCVKLYDRSKVDGKVISVKLF